MCAAGSKFVRPACYEPTRCMSHATLNRVTQLIVERAKVSGLPLEPFTVHDLRRTGSTQLNEMNVNGDWIEKCLAHEEGRSSRSVYNKAKYAEQRRHMLQEWADMVDAGINGRTHVPNQAAAAGERVGHGAQCSFVKGYRNALSAGGARCINRKRITMSDFFKCLSNWLALAMVYKSGTLSTMGAQNSGKLNRLLAELGDTRLVSSRWLRAHGYSNSLVARYVGRGWLVSPARGVYMRRGGRLRGRRGQRRCRARPSLLTSVGFLTPAWCRGNLACFD